MTKGPFLPAEFTPTQFSTAADKADFGNTLLHFIESDWKQTVFTKSFYDRLSICFGHIAHYVESVIMWSRGVIRRVDTAFKRPSTLHNCNRSWLGQTTFTYDQSRFLLTSIELPIVSQVVEASEAKPLLAVAIQLEMPVVRELLNREEVHVRELSPDTPAMVTGKITAELLSACCRLIDLLANPRDIPVLSGLIQREMIYRLLSGPEGARLRAIATSGDQSHRTARAISWIRDNYTKSVRVDDLAQIAGMGVSTLHHHFRVLTHMSPLQYQKQLRLQAARERLLVDGMDASTVAFEVGYESVSQFNREYSRLFGQPPMRDIKALREGKVVAMSVA